MLGGKFAKRPVWTAGDIEAVLSQITIDPTTSANENLEALAPIVQTLQTTSSEQAYLRSLDRFVEEKERDIEQICGDNYEDFVASVSTLLSVRQGTAHLRRRIGELDGQMGDVGRALGEKKRALLQQKKVASNIDQAIDTLQTCLRVLDGVNRVGEMIREGKYFAALRSLEDLKHLPPSAISQTPFYNHIVSSLPSLRSEIKQAVTASEKTWLFECRENGAKVGKLALDQMEGRIRRWKIKREKERERDGLNGLEGRGEKVGSVIEMTSNERIEFDPLQNDTVKIDFKPLYQCIHIYNTLECKSELQRNFHEDRKAQANLILSQRAATSPQTILTNLPGLMEELVGFFLIESHVLRSTRDFRSAREVDELWSEMSKKIVEIVGEGLRTCEDAETFLKVKGQVLAFIQTLEGYEYDVHSLTALLMTLFERYSNLLQRKFSTDFDTIVMEDDNQPMIVNDQSEFEQVIGVCWLATGEAEELALNPFPQPMPFSQTFPMCCINIRNFVDQFYQFIEGVDQHHQDINELLQKSLDGLLISHVSKNICVRISKMSNLSQIAQVVINIEHFGTACDELETVLMNLRKGHRTGSVIQLNSAKSFQSTLDFAQNRIDTIIASKLDDFFEMAEYDWTPPPDRNSMLIKGGLGGLGQNGRNSPGPFSAKDLPKEEKEPSTYLFEMITFLTAYVDSVLIQLNDAIKTKTYRMALEHVKKGLMDFLVGPDPTRYNETALRNLNDDVAFIEREIKRLNRPELDNVFVEIKSSIGIILSDAVNAYLEPSVRSSAYSAVKPKNLSKMLEKLSLAKPSGRPGNVVVQGDIDRMAKRKRESEQVARIAG